jgi:hypothetical protein
MPYQRETIRTQLDVPVIVKLDRDLRGKEVRSKFGPQRALSVNGGAATLYLDVQHCEVLRRSGAQPGDSVELVKALYKNVPTYDVHIVSDAAEPSGPRMVAPRPTYSEYANGHGDSPQQQATAAPAARANSPLAACLCAAIDAAQEAESYARSRNFSVTFLGGDIRAMANTLMMADERGGGQ